MKHKLIFFFIISYGLIGNSQELNSFERRMNEIYKSSYSVEVSDEQWLDYVGSLSQRSYQISGGDTLWDLSIIFFGDGLFWPKIWSYNQSLTNPHLLTVGQNIQFFSGSVDEPPGVLVRADAPDFEDAPEISANVPKGFKVVKNDDEESQASEQNKDKVIPKISKQKQARLRSRLYPGAPKIPPPRELEKPVLKNLPTAFTNDNTFDASKYNENGISFDLRPPVRVNPLFVVSSFLFGGDFREYPRVGRLVESENNSKLVGLNQQVYIRSKEKLQIGERFTVMGRQYPFDRNGYVGDVIQYQGSLEITDILKDNMFRGVVVNSISGIKGSPWISREEIPTLDDDFAGRPTDLKLQIIGGGGDNGTRFFRQSDVIFIGGGSSKGLRVGDILGVYKRRDIRYRGTQVVKSPTPIGHIKIYRSEPDMATGFVINSTDVIVPGDETGAPTIVEAITTQSEKNDLNDLETDLDLDAGTEKAESQSLEEELTDIQ